MDIVAGKQVDNMWKVNIFPFTQPERNKLFFFGGGISPLNKHMEVTFLELEVNPRTSSSSHVSCNKGNSNKTSQACTCPSIRHRFPPSAPETLLLSISRDALGSVSPGEICHPLSDIPVGPPLLHPWLRLSAGRAWFSQRWLCLWNISLP